MKPWQLCLVFNPVDHFLAHPNMSLFIPITVSATYLQTLKASRGLLYHLALKLEEFQPNIQFLPGKSNIYADYMSRYATPKTQTTSCIQPSGDTDSDIEEFHEVILPLSNQASIHNHHPTSARSTSAHIEATSLSFINFIIFQRNFNTLRMNLISYHESTV